MMNNIQNCDRDDNWLEHERFDFDINSPAPAARNPVDVCIGDSLLTPLPSEHYTSSTATGVTQKGIKITPEEQVLLLRDSTMLSLRIRDVINKKNMNVVKINKTFEESSRRSSDTIKFFDKEKDVGITDVLPPQFFNYNSRQDDEKMQSVCSGKELAMEKIEAETDQLTVNKCITKTKQKLNVVNKAATQKLNKPIIQEKTKINERIRIKRRQSSMPVFQKADAEETKKENKAAKSKRHSLVPNSITSKNTERILTIAENRPLVPLRKLRLIPKKKEVSSARTNTVNEQTPKDSNSVSASSKKLVRSNSCKGAGAIKPKSGKDKENCLNTPVATNPLKKSINGRKLIQNDKRQTVKDFDPRKQRCLDHVEKNEKNCEMKSSNPKILISPIRFDFDD